VEEEVPRIKSRKNLLLWYTADEPDGWGDPLDATTLAYDKIYDLDGYHPVSLVLNCQDYQFEAYAAGTDIIMQDAYTIGINATYSVVWDTVCTPDFGDCGCDNCVGEFEDISRRVDQFGDRLGALGWERTKAIWTVPQAFGGSSYWNRVPAGNEWVVQSLLAVAHGPLDRPYLRRDQSRSHKSRSATYPRLDTVCFGPPHDVHDLRLATRPFRDVVHWRPDTRCGS